MLEVTASARSVHLRNPRLELVERQPPALKVMTQVVHRRRAVGVPNQHVDALSHPSEA